MLQSADAEARAVMERRVQSLVDVLSSVYHFLQEQKTATELATAPAMPSLNSKRNRRGRKTGSGNGDLEAMEISVEPGGVRGDGVGPFAALSEKPPLKLLEDCEVIEALWTGKQSMMRRLVRRLEAIYSERCVVETPEEAAEMEEESQEQVRVCNMCCVKRGVASGIGMDFLLEVRCFYRFPFILIFFYYNIP